MSDKMKTEILKIQSYLPEYIPLDGLAVTSATYMLSERENRLRNTLVIGILHGFLHEIICNDKK